MSTMFETLGGRLARFALIVSVLISAGVAAAPMPNAARPISITAREQPIAAFLQDLFAAVDLPLVVAAGVSGSVNGTFTGPAEKVLRNVARIYNFVPYFDGAVMHVAAASDVAQRSFSVEPAAAERALRELNELNIVDERNIVRRTQTGSVVAVGTRRFLEQVEELLRAREVQRSTPPASTGAADFRVFYLRYAWAQDLTTTLAGRQVVVPGVASILRSLVGGSGGALGQEVTLNPRQPSLLGQGLAGQGAAPRAPGGEALRNAPVDQLVAALQRTVHQPMEAPPPFPPSPSTASSGQHIRIEADPRLNAVIVRDLTERLPRYEQLIAALDVEPQSVEIEATIIDVNTDKLRELGMKWSWNNDGNGASFAGAIPAFGLGGIASVVLGSAGHFLARIRALQAEGAARVVSSPQVVTLSNVEAVFDNSSTFYVRVPGRDYADLFNVSAGTSLRVTPHVFRDRDANRIKLLVNIADGSLTGRQVDQIPVVERATINTQALIAEGESLLIGGMVRETQSFSEDKVPGLGDVPVVGKLFSTRANASTRVERMFLITPRLAGTRAATSNGTSAPSGGSAVFAAPRRPPVEFDLNAPLPYAPQTPPAADPPQRNAAGVMLRTTLDPNN